MTALGVVVWPMTEFEADDALASGAAAAATDPRVRRVLICTPDKDLAQCVRGTRVVQLNRRTRVVMDEAGVTAKFGVPPASIPDYLALVGDAADGYPGLPGWGAKSAAAVLARFGHIEAIPGGLALVEGERAESRSACRDARARARSRDALSDARHAPDGPSAVHEHRRVGMAWPDPWLCRARGPAGRRGSRYQHRGVGWAVAGEVRHLQRAVRRLGLRPRLPVRQGVPATTGWSSRRSRWRRRSRTCRPAGAPSCGGRRRTRVSRSSACTGCSRRPKGCT